MLARRRCRRRRPSAPRRRTESAREANGGHPGAFDDTSGGSPEADPRPALPPRPARPGHTSGVLGPGVSDAHDERRIADDSQLAVHDARELVERLEAVLGAGLGDVLLGALQDLRAQTLGHRSEHALDLDTRVPDVEVPHLGELPHRAAIGACRPQHHGAPRIRIEPAVSPGYLEARPKTFDVPFERTGQRLVEVVDAEDEIPIGCEKRAEVGEMRVATELNVQPAARTSREIRCHEVGAAAEERERGDEHSAVPDRHQLRNTRGGLLLEQSDGVGAMRAGRPICVGPAWNLRARCLTARAALGRREVRNLRRSHGPVRLFRRTCTLVVADSRHVMAHAPPASGEIAPPRGSAGSHRRCLWDVAQGAPSGARPVSP